ncbi:zinc finger protein 827-like [Haemaphysalis longicornis]
MDEGLQSTQVARMAELEGEGDQGGTFDLSVPLPVESVVCSHPCNSQEAHRQLEESSRHPGIERRLFPCDISHRPFGRNRNLLRHYRLVLGETRPFQCRRCGHSFDVEAELHTHMKIVHGLRP